MTDRIEVDQLGVARAADICRTTGYDAGRELWRLLGGLTKEVIEAAAGHDDYGQQISSGWVNSHADTFAAFGKAIETHLVGRGDQMSACGQNAKATDDDASRQVQGTALGLTRTAEGWAMTPTPEA
ncbi:hypothetical protein ACWGID_16375 [Kribbella sp. NPDC054772]